jgi:aconitate hydratase 2/2-methylisocitrate dehydratase
MVVLSSILGRIPTIEEYKAAVQGINLTDFEPPSADLSVEPQTVPVRVIG